MAKPSPNSDSQEFFMGISVSDPNTLVRRKQLQNVYR